MGTFKSFIESKGITAAQVATTSKRIEATDHASRTLLVKRAEKRRVKETADKKYAELNLEKPKTSGRGINSQQVELAVADKDISRKSRAKIVRAVNVILAAKKEPAVDTKALFEGTKARAGKKPVTAEKK
jgi:hypothetical protein